MKYCFLDRVSSDAMASDDEEDVQDGSLYEDSFIDDGSNSTTSNTQAGSSRVDMMAIYRLSITPFIFLLLSFLLGVFTSGYRLDLR